MSQQILDSVFALPEADQLKLIDLIRHRLYQVARALTDDQKAMLDEEANAIAADGDLGLPWEGVEAEIRSSLDRRRHSRSASGPKA